MTQQHNYLYVDDDPVNREVMETLLVELVGVESLVMFEDSDNFIPRLKELKPAPDIILLDIGVAPHDGFEMLAMLRSDEAFRESRVIAVTAGPFSQGSDKIRQAGFDGALAKPLDVARFPELIVRLQSGEHVWQLN
jgi:CheY-like chemotaxis protein